MSITFLQTSDPYVYADLLAQTSKTIRLFCKEHGFSYEAYLGVKRGYWPWQASFNRIYLIHEMIDRGYEGWIIYIDADAYIVNLDFDLRGFMSGFRDKAFAATPSGASDHLWDINNGVFFLNVSHPTGRHIVRRWKEMYEAADSAMLKRCTDFYMGIDDQAMLHDILRGLANPAKDCFRCPWDIVNSPNASFIRQQLRAMSPDLPSRLSTITEAVDAVTARNI